MSYKDEQMSWQEYLIMKRKAVKCLVCGKKGTASHFCKDCYAKQVKARRERLGEPIETEVERITLESKTPYKPYKRDYTRKDLLDYKIQLKHVNRCIKRLNALLRDLQNNVRHTTQQLNRKAYLEMKLNVVKQRQADTRHSIKDAYRYFRSVKVWNISALKVTINGK
jgi:hypothetical protein